MIFQNFQIFGKVGTAKVQLLQFNQFILTIFQEVCHVCFRGVDESNCQVRLIGDMMISFPAGIVQVVASNPNPSPLLFRIKNSDLIESVVANKHLIAL